MRSNEVVRFLIDNKFRGLPMSRTLTNLEETYVNHPLIQHLN